MVFLSAEKCCTRNVSDPTKHNYLDALKAAFENIAVPVLYDVDIGHIPPRVYPWSMEPMRRDFSLKMVAG